LPPGPSASSSGTAIAVAPTARGIAAVRRSSPPHREEDEGGSDESQRHQRRPGSLNPADDVAGLADQKADRDFAEPVAEAELADPFGVPVGHLVVGEGCQQRRRQPDYPEPGKDRPAAPPPEQDDLGDQREDREVVRRHRQRREDPPGDEVALFALPLPLALHRPHAVEERERAEEAQQRVGARLLRVPEQHRVDRDQRRRDQADPLAAQLAPDQVRDRDRGDAGDGGERAQPPLAGAGHLRPEPGEHVVEGRRRLGEADRIHRVSEAHPQHPAGGDDLVVVVGLGAEGGEAQYRPQRGNADEQPEEAGAVAH
jgi:hypothetical protein